MIEWTQRQSSRQALDNRGFNNTGTDSEYQRDRARVIHSASFRALQSKTQVLGLGESDFYRTRLTHSLEVAQIGSGISEWLRHQNREHQQALSWLPSFSLIEAICLAHDLGHSPYGHGGEIALNYMMQADGGYEANAQTLRILTRLGEYSPADGLDLTRRTLLGVIKYPVFYTEVSHYSVEMSSPVMDNGGASGAIPHNLFPWHPPKCLYDDSRDVLAWILEPMNDADQKRFLKFQPRETGHGVPCYKGLDTSIMELADDIAYGVHDLEDAVALGLLPRDLWQSRVADWLAAELPENTITREIEVYTQRLFSHRDSERKHAVSKLVGYLIHEISLTSDPAFSHPLLSLQATMSPDALKILKRLKSFVMDAVIRRPELQALQYKGQRVIIELFEILASNPDTLLPLPVRQRFQDNRSDPLRTIADYIAGMTDLSAARQHNRLTRAGNGSIFDRL